MHSAECMAEKIYIASIEQVGSGNQFKGNLVGLETVYNLISSFTPKFDPEPSSVKDRDASSN
jgi:hypothetical protein